MQAIVNYGRFISRAVISGFYGEIQNRDFSLSLFGFSPFLASRSNASNRSIAQTAKTELKLIIAHSGFSKNVYPPSRQPQLTRPGLYGDDAWFCAEWSHLDFLGVADGVGGWRSYGVDPSKFSRSLMSTCERLIREGKITVGPNAPKEVLSRAYEEMQKSKVHIIGSSTACIVAFHKENNTLYTANLGDSGFAIIRNNRFVHRSREQQHYFNSPFQLTIDSSGAVEDGQIFGDSPDLAESGAFDLEEGDLILVASDGLWDNLTEKMILGELAHLRDRSESSIQRAAHVLASRAIQLGFDPDYMSPFAIAAKRVVGEEVRGGKPDDVTVLLASVSSSKNSH